MTDKGKSVISRGLEIAWKMDDFTDPWRQAETVLLMHGIAEAGDAFRGWVPHLARNFRVLRPDFRGYGESSAVADDATLDIATFADDIEALVTKLGLTRVHLVGAKLGAQVALHLAQRQPKWLASMSLAGVLISPNGALGQWVDQWIELVDRTGVQGWAKSTMPGRMGPSLSPEAMQWWEDFMGTAPSATVKACFRMLPSLREPAQLEQIICPTQVLVGMQKGQSGQFDQRQPLEDVRRWQSRIPKSSLCEIQADSYHIAASHPDVCARAVSSFIQGLSS